MHNESQLAPEFWEQGERSSILDCFFVFNCRMQAGLWPRYYGRAVAVAGAGSACPCWCDLGFAFAIWMSNKEPKSSRDLHMHVHVNLYPPSTWTCTMSIHIAHAHAPNTRTLAGIMLPKLHIRMSFLRFASEQKQNAQCDMQHNRPKQKKIKIGTGC